MVRKSQKSQQVKNVMVSDENETIVELTSPSTSVNDSNEVSDTLNEDNPVTIYVNKLNKYVENISKMNHELKQLVHIGKTLEKDFNQIVKLLAKKNKNKNENRTLTGFAMPSYLTDEMYEFLNIEKGKKVHRIDVTRSINKYIEENGFRRETDKRFFVPNDILHNLFRSTEKDEVSYFNLQAYIKHHFVKEYTPQPSNI